LPKAILNDAPESSNVAAEAIRDIAEATGAVTVPNDGDLVEQTRASDRRCFVSPEPNARTAAIGFLKG
jgi:hypothetical protein